MGKWEKWPKVSVGPGFDGTPGLTIELPKGLGQIYRENQYVSDVYYRFDVKEEVGELTKIWGYVEIVGGIAGQFRYGEELTLHLDDGRSIEIVIKTLDFNRGEYLFTDKSVEEKNRSGILPKRDGDETKDKGSNRVPH